MSLPDRIRGCIIGSAIGDAMGGPVEFAPRRLVRRVAGVREWVSGLLPYTGPAAAHGSWRNRAPAGSTTDDTRLRVIFLEAAIRRGRRVLRPADLAREILRRYAHPAKYYPRNGALAKKWLETWTGPARGVLGRRHRGAPPSVAAVAPWAGRAACHGPLTAMLAGLANPGKSAEAYRAGFDLAFHDTGYARDAAGIGAAVIAEAVSIRPGGKRGMAAWLSRAARIDPYKFRKVMLDGRPMMTALEKALELARRAPTTKGAVRRFAPWFSMCEAHDPRVILGGAFVSLVVGGDAVGAVTIAANHRVHDSRGRTKRMCDTDTLAGVTGAFAGALYGASAFPAEWRQRVVTVNREIYGFDLDGIAERFIAAMGY